MKTVNQFLFVFLISLIIQLLPSVSCQAFTIKGKVLNEENKKPLRYALIILLKNGDQITGALSDSLGEYRFDSLDSGRYTIQIKYVGNKTRTLNFDLISDISMINHVEAEPTKSKTITIRKRCCSCPTYRLVSNPYPLTTLRTDSIYKELGLTESLTTNRKLWSVYPNPTSGILHIQASKDYESIEIADYNGHVVKQFSGHKSSGIFSIDLNDLPGGVYFVRLRIKDDVHVKKVVLVS
jgi:hypothetical protein